MNKRFSGFPIKMSKIWILVQIALVFLASLVLGDCGERNKGNEIVEVLMWSGGSWAGFFEKDYFHAPNYLGHDIDKTKWNCPVDCRYTADKSRVGNVDAVIFEAQPLTDYFDAYKWNPPHFPPKYYGQQWVNHGYETHIYFNLYGDPGYMNYIDVNFTYYLESQVPITFTCMWGGGTFEDLLKPPPPKSKDKCVIFMSTNCGSGGALARTAYAAELMEHMQVDSYGQCLHNKDFPKEMQFPIYQDHGASMRNKIGIFKDYKFVLVFENNNVTDYVTEKMMCAIEAGSVPVYMGSPNVHPYWTPGENSVIKTDDFQGPAHLAKHLQFLCDNDDEYNKLFEWKKTGPSEHFKQRFNDCAFYGAECRLCQYLLEQRNKLSPKQKQKVEQRRRFPHHSYKAAQFESHSYLTMQASPNLDLMESFSLSMWIKARDTDPVLIDRSGIYTLKLIPTRDRAVPQLCVLDECFTSSVPVNTKDWQHVAVVFNYSSDMTGEVKFWVNGKEDISSEIPTKCPDASDYKLSPPLLIGTDQWHTKYYSGLIDDISIWKTGLPPHKAKSMVYDIYSGAEDGIGAFWSFNSEEGTELVDSVSGIEGTIMGYVDFVESATKPLVTCHPCL